MLERKIQTILSNVAKHAFPDHKIDYFKIMVIQKELKGRFGDYNGKEKVIRIFRLSDPKHIVKTAIHELAHHVEFSIYKATGHSKRFYEIMKKLFESAMTLGVLELQDVYYEDGGNDIHTMGRHLGKLQVPTEKITTDRYNVRVIKNSFAIKDQLSEKGYRYAKLEQVWIKEVNQDNLNIEQTFLNSILIPDSYEIISANEINIQAIFYISVQNSFEHRDTLKSNGYIFGGYGIKKGKPWVKKVRADDVSKEKLFLNKLDGVRVEILSVK